LIDNNKNGFIINSEYLNSELYSKMKYFILNKKIIPEFGKYSREKFNKINNPKILIDSINKVI
jgi:hypothetical protein